jgi:hypothetical protein
MQLIAKLRRRTTVLLTECAGEVAAAGVAHFAGDAIDTRQAVASMNNSIAINKTTSN